MKTKSYSYLAATLIVASAIIGDPLAYAASGSSGGSNSNSGRSSGEMEIEVHRSGNHGIGAEMEVEMHKNNQRGRGRGNMRVRSIACDTRLRARLIGPAIGGITPSGKADFRDQHKLSDQDHRTKLNVEVQRVNLPAGSELKVFVNGMHVGTITLGSQPLLRAQLHLDMQRGDNVPHLNKGDKVRIEGPDGKTILNGEFLIKSIQCRRV